MNTTITTTSATSSTVTATTPPPTSSTLSLALTSYHQRQRPLTSRLQTHPAHLSALEQLVDPLSSNGEGEPDDNMAGEVATLEEAEVREARSEEDENVITR